MCGICGVLNKDDQQSVDQGRLIAMRDVMVHRGPDDAGLYVSQHVGLGARRLSIIDVTGGHQPISNEDETIWVVQNGEIYNFTTLRQELISKGHTFKTRSDTEVIVHLYEEIGADFVHRLEGMFAVALWNDKEHRLILARDKMGIKPLYYTITSDCLLFASEIKALLQWPQVRRELNTGVLPEYLAFRYVAGPATLFQDIFSLLPGHLLLADGCGVRTQQYWSVEADLAEKADNNLGTDRLASQLADLLNGAVRSHMVSDVPLGTLSSGGLDSSALTAYAAQQSCFTLNTFSVGFTEPGFDESPYARLVSRRCQTNHHELYVTNEMFAETLPKLAWFNDVPIDQPNSVAIYLICSLAKKSVTVLLSGEGADELFGGYPRYLIPRVYLPFRRLPRLLQGMSRWTLSGLSARRLQKLREALSLSPSEAVIQNAAYVRFDIIRHLCTGESDLSFPGRLKYLEGHRSLLDNCETSFDGFVESLLLYEQQTYLVSLLERQDKMSMAASIESRVPCLDCHIVNFANTLPTRLKIKGSNGKHLLKMAVRPAVPIEILQKKKWGFGVPLATWFRDPKGMGCHLDILRSIRFRERGYFRSEVVESLIQQHLSGAADHSEILWVLINLELWHQTFLYPPSLAV